jgi:hypothetical protein
MIRNPDRLEALHPSLQSRDTATDEEHYARGLAVFTSLWRHAEAIGDLSHDSWREDIEPDIAIARVLNYHRSSD